MLTKEMIAEELKNAEANGFDMWAEDDAQIVEDLYDYSSVTEGYTVDEILVIVRVLRSERT